MHQRRPRQRDKPIVGATPRTVGLLVDRPSLLLISAVKVYGLLRRRNATGRPTKAGFHLAIPVVHHCIAGRQSCKSCLFRRPDPAGGRRVSRVSGELRAKNRAVWRLPDARDLVIAVNGDSVQMARWSLGLFLRIRGTSAGATAGRAVAQPLLVDLDPQARAQWAGRYGAIAHLERLVHDLAAVSAKFTKYSVMMKLGMQRRHLHRGRQADGSCCYSCAATWPHSRARPSRRSLSAPGCRRSCRRRGSGCRRRAARARRGTVALGVERLAGHHGDVDLLPHLGQRGHVVRRAPAPRYQKGLNSSSMCATRMACMGARRRCTSIEQVDVRAHRLAHGAHVGHRGLLDLLVDIQSPAARGRGRT